MSPRIRIVVVTYNGGAFLERCLESLSAIQVAAEELEVVVVDNASTDGSTRRLRTRYPHTTWIRADRNLGFAAGNNLALRDLGDVDYVALVNNDAFVEPGCLTPLVSVLESDPTLGAACPKTLLAGRFIEIELTTPTLMPGRGDYRMLGVRLSGVRVDGQDRMRNAQFVEGWHGWERGHEPEALYQWSGERATIRLPWASDSQRSQLQLAANRDQEVRIKSGDVEGSNSVGSDARWVDVEVGGPPVDVINCVGGVAIEGGYAGDRGFLEIDRGQFDLPEEVFAWSGCAVLLRRRYLEHVGLFDPRLFLYYEDFDLAWRGRAQGWRYVYVPDSVVRHEHAATSVEGSPIFQYHVERNRLLVHAKNAPAAYALHAFVRYVGGTAVYALQDVVSPLLHLRSPKLGRVPRRLTTVLAFLCSLGPFLADRRRVRSSQLVPDEQLMQWIVGRASR